MLITYSTIDMLTNGFLFCYLEAFIFIKLVTPEAGEMKGAFFTSLGNSRQCNKDNAKFSISFVLKIYLLYFVLQDHIFINYIGESTMQNFWHSISTNWSIMAARTQMEQVQLEEFNFKGMKSTDDKSTTYALIQIIHKVAYSSCKTMFLSRL